MSTIHLTHVRLYPQSGCDHVKLIFDYGQCFYLPGRLRDGFSASLCKKFRLGCKDNFVAEELLRRHHGLLRGHLVRSRTDNLLLNQVAANHRIFLTSQR